MMATKCVDRVVSTTVLLGLSLTTWYNGLSVSASLSLTLSTLGLCVSKMCKHESLCVHFRWLFSGENDFQNVKRAVSTQRVFVFYSKVDIIAEVIYMCCFKLFDIWQKNLSNLHTTFTRARASHCKVQTIVWIILPPFLSLDLSLCKHKRV